MRGGKAVIIHMKKYILLIFALLTVLSFPLYAHGAIDVVLDGEKINMADSDGNTVEPFISNGTTYVPVRAVADAFGIGISWDQASHTVFLGEKSGSPVLNDYINIYYNGEEFTALDASGAVVRPILNNGTTYLPIRAIGELFGKKVSWDAVSTTAILASPCNANALDYFTNAVKNTAEAKNLTVNLSFKAELFHEGQVISSVSSEGTENYAKGVFSIEDILPEDYEDSISYCGEGKYFLSVQPSKFMFMPYVKDTFDKRGLSCGFSVLSVTVLTKGQYITDIKVSAEANALYNNFPMHMTISINAPLSYPAGFQFPLTPYPPIGSSDNSNTANNASAEAEEITPVVKAYMEYLFNADAESLASLLSKRDYSALFANISDAQKKLKFKEAKKTLEKMFEGADGSYEVTAMAYADTSVYAKPPEKAVTVTVSYKKTTQSPLSYEMTITLIKTDGKWYADLSFIREILALS